MKAMDKHEQLLGLVRERPYVKFNLGIGVASAYFNQVKDCGKNDEELFALFNKAGVVGVERAAKEAEKKLTYVGDDLQLDEVLTSKSAIEKAAGDRELPSNTLMLIRHVLTTPKEDRDGDVLQTGGAQIDERMPLLWQHIATLPIGKLFQVLEHNDKHLKMGTILLDMNELTHDAAVLLEADALRFSHGFRALDFQQRKQGDDSSGFEVLKFEILEESLVSVPSNTDAVIESVSRKKLKSEVFKNFAQATWDARPKQHVVPDDIPDDDPSAFEKAAGAALGENDEVYDPVRWNKQFSEKFDTELEHLEPATLTLDWVSRFLGCSVKHVFDVFERLPSSLVGTWLHFFDAKYGEPKDIRSITYGGKEVPPSYETIQLNSEKSQQFLVEGLMFFRAEGDHPDFVLDVCPTYYGLRARLYTRKADSEWSKRFFDERRDEAYQKHFMKGEAFSLSGAFLKKGNLRWDDVILPAKNKKAMELFSKAIDDRKASRGVIAMGPPGTGKTLSAKTILDTTPATFIWVSSRDFYYSGAMGGIMHAYDVARKLSPSVVVLEDVDNWMGDRVFDLLKTELDGVGTQEEVYTLLTTNYPDRLPKALVDRPGRFHDVVKFDLPKPEERLTMLRRWLPACGQYGDLVEKTKGYSGAHLFEMCSYARTLAEEQPEDIRSTQDWEKWAIEALEKVEEQRELIGASAPYRPRKSIVEAIERSVTCGGRAPHYATWEIVDVDDFSPKDNHSPPKVEEPTVNQAASVIYKRASLKQLVDIRAKVGALIESEHDHELAEEVKSLNF